MQDRPTYDELLEAIETFLDREIVPNVPGSRGFHARVAANALRIVRRELDQREGAVAEWEGLATLGAVERPATIAALADALRDRNAELCERIRAGDADDGPFAAAVRGHVTRTISEKLRVSDPGLLERSGSDPSPR
jgi:hypothetical protein